MKKFIYTQYTKGPSWEKGTVVFEIESESIADADIQAQKHLNIKDLSKVHSIGCQVLPVKEL